MFRERLQAMPCDWIVMESAGVELSAKGVPYSIPVVSLDPQTFITNSCLPSILAITDSCLSLYTSYYKQLSPPYTSYYRQLSLSILAITNSCLPPILAITNSCLPSIY